MMKVLIIVNPVSGKKKRDKYYNKIKSNLENLGYEVKIEFYLFFLEFFLVITVFM